MANRDVRIRIGGDSTEAVNALQQAENKLKGFAGEVNATRNTLTGFAGAFSFVGAGLMARELLQAAVSVDKFSSSMTYATGSAQQGAIELQFVRAEALRLGLDLETAQEGFVKIAASARGTALEGKATRDIFAAISEASVVMGLSADETNGSLLAISQMISKGTVSAEELRGQLGERLPGAFQIAARAMGVTTSELDGMLKKGEVVATDFLPKLAAEMHKAFGGQAEKVDTTQKAVNRFNTAVYDLKQTIVEGGASDAMKTLIGWGTSLVSVFKDAVRWIREATVYWGELGAKAKAWYDAGGLIGMMKAENREQYRRAFQAAEDAAAESMLEIAAQFDKKAVGAPGKSGGGGGGGKGGKKGLTDEQKQALRDGKEQVAQFFKVLDEEVSTDLAREDYAGFLNKAIGIGFDDGLRGSGSRYKGLLGGGGKPSLWGPQDQADAETAGINARGELTPEQQRQFDESAQQSKWGGLKSTMQEDRARNDFNAMVAESGGDSFAEDRARLDEQQQYWVDHYAMRADNYLTYQERVDQIGIYYADRRKSLDRQEVQQKLSLSAGAFGSMASIADSFYQLSGKKSRAAFEAGKAMKIGETVYTTASAAMKAYDAMANIKYVGPVLGAMAAAAAVASGAAQIAAIKSATPEGGGSFQDIGPGGQTYGEGTPSSPVITQPAAQQQAPAQITIHIDKAIGERKWFEDNLPEVLKDFGSRNVNIGVKYAA